MTPKGRLRKRPPYRMRRLSADVAGRNGAEEPGDAGEAAVNGEGTVGNAVPSEPTSSQLAAYGVLLRSVSGDALGSGVVRFVFPADVRSTEQAGRIDALEGEVARLRAVLGDIERGAA